MLKTRQILSVILALLLTATRPLVLYSQSANPGNPTEAAPQGASQLQALVAPIALYPDSLVAQILTAATFPDQVAIANYWLEQNKDLSGNPLMQEVDKQSWDPSVKALTQFPSVLDNLAKNLSWTSSLGEAYHNQQSEVMTAIQTLRAQAKAKGSLESNSKVTVVQQSPQTIVIQPANPQIVYVPQYNPTIVYGVPYVVPGYVAPSYTAGDVAAAGIIGFGAGIAVGAMMSGGCCSWGYSSWNCGWHGTAVSRRELLRKCGMARRVLRRLWNPRFWSVWRSEHLPRGVRFGRKLSRLGTQWHLSHWHCLQHRLGKRGFAYHVRTRRRLTYERRRLQRNHWRLLSLWVQH